MKTSEIQIRDPFVWVDRAAGKYWLFGTTDKDCWNGPGVGFDAYCSRDLVEWEGPYPAFRPKAGFWGEKNFWAPEVHAYRGAFYMFASFKNERVCRGTAILRSEKIEGPYLPWSEGAVTPGGCECLDGTLCVDESGTPWMVYCHEWVQVGDGKMMAVQLREDLKGVVGEPVELFRASAAKWAKGFEWDKRPGTKHYVTDGPFMYRSPVTGRLWMMWSSTGYKGYAMGLAWSESGKLTGPWVQEEVPLWGEDGGHGMLFTGLDGELYVTLHGPNNTPMERPMFRKVEEREGKLMLVGE